jgi:hypothetical protein
MDAITYRKYEDNPRSVSKSPEYRLAQPAFLQALMRLPITPAVTRIVKRKLVVALNGSATLMLDRGELRAAAALHLECIKSGGWRYLPFTRRIVAGMLSRKRKTKE